MPSMSIDSPWNTETPQGFAEACSWIDKLRAEVKEAWGHHTEEESRRCDFEARVLELEDEVAGLRKDWEKRQRAVEQRTDDYLEARKQRDAALRALENVRAQTARRIRRTDPESAELLLRFCAEAGVRGNILR